jgi:hypothetical protein
MEHQAKSENGQEKDDLKTSTGKLKESVSDYVKIYGQLAKAKATRAASNAASGAVIAIVSIILVFFFLSFLFTALAWWIGDMVDSTAGGFLIVAGFFLLLFILILALRKKVIIPAIRNAIISKVYE